MGRSSEARVPQRQPDREEREVVARLDDAELPEFIIRLGHIYEARRGFGNDLDLAGALGAPPDQVERWRRGETADEGTERLLRDLALVVSLLLEYYHPAVIADWLYGLSPDLGGRPPIEVLREGGLADVIAAIDSQTSGAFL